MKEFPGDEWAQRAQKELRHLLNVPKGMMYIAAGDLILVDQYIDKTFRRKSSFFEGVAAVHCEMAQPVCSNLRAMLAKTAKNIDVKTHLEGTYICMEGPQFSTRAESLLHRAWGGDLIGMTGT